MEENEACSPVVEDVARDREEGAEALRHYGGGHT
jgi:hypothetical protein